MRLIDKDALLVEYDRVHIGEQGRARKLIEDAPEVFPYTDEEVQKIQDMQSAEVEKAFELGREDAEPQWIPCSNCARNADNGGLYPDGRTRCPIQEHYALPKDGYCHLAEPWRGEE